MKATIRQALSCVGLATAGQVQRLTEESRRISKKVKSLEERVVMLRAHAETWKQRHDEAVARVRECKDATAAAAREWKDEAERLRAGAEHAKVRAETLKKEKLNLRAHLEEAQRTAITARDYVMATEAKLDLIEAAIQLLDSRTREAEINRP